MNRQDQPISTKSNRQVRQILTALGILLLTFGAFAWQLRAFNERNSEGAAEAPPVLEPPPGTHWHEATSEVRMAVATCIRSQLAELRRKNYSAALQYHTAAVRQTFPNVSDFQREIELNYPQFPSHKKVAFRFVNMDKKHLFANAGISVTAPNGEVFDTVFLLSYEGQQWGVRGITRPHLAARRR